MRCGKIRPGRGDEGPRAVGKNQKELEGSTALRPSYDLKPLSLEGMARAEDCYVIGIAVEVVVGSVSCGPWIESTTTF